MGVEIERKFLVKTDDWRALGSGVLYRQGYIVKAPEATVRVRVVGEQGYLTLKGKQRGLVRPEFEYPIPVADALAMMELWCHPYIVEKMRYRIPLGGLTWEVDEFLGLNQGLILAEVELDDPQQTVPLPDWIGEEVSDQPQYYNSYLARQPYALWQQTLPQ